jgi:hypothetical protein
VIADVMNRRFVGEALDAVRAQAEDARARDEVVNALVDDDSQDLDRSTAPETLDEVIAALPDLGGGPRALVDAGDEEEFIARDPLVSLLQTELERKLRQDHPELLEETGMRDPSETPAADRRLREPINFTHGDWKRWGIGWLKGVASKVAQGTREFNEEPAEVEIADDARVIVVGDWASGLKRAQAVGRLMAREMEAALAEGREAHVIHLGDVYYSGDWEEYDMRMLGPGLWPVRPEHAERGVTSWSLNANHDMYGGGWGYFDHLLADERFAGQRSSDGRGTSLFRLRNSRWDLLGLDTGWTSRLLDRGHEARLEGHQDEWVEEVTRDGRRAMLLSHHQPVTGHEEEDIGAVLWEKLGRTIDAGGVDAWIWGHEHRCVGFKPGRVPYMRCVGHGGVPVKHRPARHDNVAWEHDRVLDGGEGWARFGFAVLDFEAGGDRVGVRYVDDDGGSPEPAAETIDPA